MLLFRIGVFSLCRLNLGFQKPSASHLHKAGKINFPNFAEHKIPMSATSVLHKQLEQRETVRIFDLFDGNISDDSHSFSPSLK